MIDVPNNKDHTLAGAGHMFYNKYCISCHGVDQKGNGSTIPGLADLSKKYNEQ
jgi:quinoprotein glucose dehydrogenase